MHFFTPPPYPHGPPQVNPITIGDAKTTDGRGGWLPATGAFPYDHGHGELVFNIPEGQGKGLEVTVHVGMQQTTCGGGSCTFDYDPPNIIEAIQWEPRTVPGQGSSLVTCHSPPPQGLGVPTSTKCTHVLADSDAVKINAVTVAGVKIEERQVNCDSVYQANCPATCVAPGGAGSEAPAGSVDCLADVVQGSCSEFVPKGAWEFDGVRECEIPSLIKLVGTSLGTSSLRIRFCDVREENMDYARVSKTIERTLEYR